MNTNALKLALLTGLAAALPMQSLMANEASDPAVKSTVDVRAAEKNLPSSTADQARAGTDEARHAADNSAVNKRDRDDRTIVPTDQPNNKVDIDLAAAVRSAIVADDSLSMAAHNIKLIAANGTVVLRGPVESLAEKNRIAEIVTGVKGVTSLENDLEVAAP